MLVLSLLLFDDGECGNDNRGDVKKHCKANSNNIFEDKLLLIWQPTIIYFAAVS